jgi:hypothetical protein
MDTSLPVRLPSSTARGWVNGRRGGTSPHSESRAALDRSRHQRGPQRVPATATQLMSGRQKSRRGTHSITAQF